MTAAIDRSTDEIALFDTQTLRVLSPNAKGKYEERVSREINGSLSGVVAIGGGRVLLARANGEVNLFDAARLEPGETFRPEAKNAPRFAVAAPDGKTFAVLFHNRRLWLFDTPSNRELKLSITGQGDISAAAFAGNDRLLVADRFTRVTEYELPSGRITDRRRPTLSVLEKVYLFGVQPIYTIFPKPGELGNVVNYLLTDSESVPVGSRERFTNQPAAARYMGSDLEQSGLYRRRRRAGLPLYFSQRFLRSEVICPPAFPCVRQTGSAWRRAVCPGSRPRRAR